MTGFSAFTDDELDDMEIAFCNEGLTYLIDEIRRERRCRESFLPVMRYGESRKAESEDENELGN